MPRCWIISAIALRRCCSRRWSPPALLRPRRPPPDASADLILAADVMVYVHDMTPLLAEVARVLASGGLFAFTVESHAGEGVVLGEGLRYAYGASRVRSLIAAAGLTLDRMEPASSRTESGAQVPDLVAVAVKA